MNFCSLALIFFFGIPTLELAAARLRRPEETWRPGVARDLSKYKPRAALVTTRRQQEDNVYVQFARALKQESVRKQEQTTTTSQPAATTTIAATT